MNVFKPVLIYSLMTALCGSASFWSLQANASDYRDVINEFDQYKQSTEAEFEAFEKAIDLAYQEFMGEIEAVWGDTTFTSRHQWVEYDETLTQRTLVDYQADEIVVEFIDVDADQVSSVELAEQLNKTLSSTLAQAVENDPVLQKAAEQSNQTIQVEGESAQVTMLPELLTSQNENSMAVAKALTTGDGVSQSYLPSSRRLTVVITLPEEYGMKKADRYWEATAKYAKEWKLEPALVMAIIHTESSFNPMARSRIPAYGLMQIVPRTAGKDAAKKIYGKSKLFKAKYLYNPENNIRVGAAYLNVLNYRYLRGIHNPESRLYCTIAAYNTGTANVAKAFIDQKSMQKAYARINQLEPSEVYDILATRLPYKETRGYLKKVVGRYLQYVN
ncbi:murein transglycosylase domain-containing protein [Litoribacillus peritrichatus]|uniref:Membrane-bound lytic murein transglycosylase MltC n=1 Tax=Litoribacillus peritrichatus TaxID=718191 RepID=A0ABP7N7Z9_9GAMM